MNNAVLKEQGPEGLTLLSSSQVTRERSRPWGSVRKSREERRRWLCTDLVRFNEGRNNTELEKPEGRLILLLSNFNVVLHRGLKGWKEDRYSGLWLKFTHISCALSTNLYIINSTISAYVKKRFSRIILNIYLKAFCSLKTSSYFLKYSRCIQHCANSR